LERAGGLQYCAEGFGVRDEPSARRFPFALGGDGIGAPGQNPKFEFRWLTEQGNDFGAVIHGSPRGRRFAGFDCERFLRRIRVFGVASPEAPTATSSASRRGVA
jgi:hypothetical protein